MNKQELLTLIRALEKRIDELEKRPKTETHTHYHNYPRYPSPGWWGTSTHTDPVFASGGMITHHNLASATSTNGSSDGQSS